jgi:hypothetical protein
LNTMQLFELFDVAHIILNGYVASESKWPGLRVR